MFELIKVIVSFHRFVPQSQSCSKTSEAMRDYMRYVIYI